MDLPLESDLCPSESESNPPEVDWIPSSLSRGLAATGLILVLLVPEGRLIAFGVFRSNHCKAIPREIRNPPRTAPQDRLVAPYFYFNPPSLSVS